MIWLVLSPINCHYHPERPSPFMALAKDRMTLLTSRSNCDIGNEKLCVCPDKDASRVSVVPPVKSTPEPFRSKFGQLLGASRVLS